MSKWFIEASGQVEGPYSTELVQARIRDGQLSSNDQIWGRVMEEWRTITWWQASLNEIINKENQIANPEVWHYAYQGSTLGPLSWNDLIHKLKLITSASIENLMQVMIWTQGMKAWAPVTDFHEIMDDVGINKRQHPRGQISGRAVIKSKGNTFIAPMRTISEGGFGTDMIAGLMSGESVTVEIQSGDFADTVHAKAQVSYVSETIAGFKFTNINVESKGLVVQYVRKAGPNTQSLFPFAA